jgi:hypothetical protein
MIGAVWNGDLANSTHQTEPNEQVGGALGRHFNVAHFIP